LDEALTDGGFEVLKAKDGVEALKAIEADMSQFRAIVTDIKLGPGPDGWEVTRGVRELIPNMPIVYMSGDSAHEWASRGVPGSIMLAKPFAPAQVITAVATLVTEAEMQLPPTSEAD